MQLDKHFMYMPSMSLDAYAQAGRTPLDIHSLLERLDDLEDNEMGALFDMTRAEGDLLGHPEMMALLQACEARGIAVTIRVHHNALKACKTTLDALSQQGLIAEIRIVACHEEIEKSGFFQSLLKLSPASLRRAALEIDILKTLPASFDPLTKSILPHERRDMDIVFDVTRAQSLPRIQLRMDAAADPFEPAFEAHIHAWRAELTGLLRVVRIAFDVASYQAIQPGRIASFVRPVSRRAPVFFVYDSI